MLFIIAFSQRSEHHHVQIPVHHSSKTSYTNSPAGNLLSFPVKKKAKIYDGEFRKREKERERELIQKTGKKRAQSRSSRWGRRDEYSPSRRRDVIAPVVSSWRLMVVVVYGGGHTAVPPVSYQAISGQSRRLTSAPEQ